MTRLRFTETMSGFAALGAQDFQRGYDEGKRAGSRLALRLTLSTDDVDAFISSRDRLLQVTGEIEYAPLGGKLPTRGTVNQLIDVGGDRRRKSMPYRLDFTDAKGRPLVLSAVKNVANDAGFDAWKDTTTLYVSLSDPGGGQVGAGIVYISFLAFAGQFPTYRVSGGSAFGRALAVPRFYGSFLAKLWEVYGFHQGDRR
jgi:cholesterol oxidase